MKSIGKFVGALGALYFAASGAVLAAPACNPGQVCNVPEPGSLALVGIAIAGAVWVARKSKK